MSLKTDRFIKAIAPLAQAEYQNRSRWVLPSVCIAQAAIESGWNPKAKTLFGIKGAGNTLKTTEYINGKYIATTASFKSYPSLAAAVHGYYDLITENSRYSAAVNNPDFQSTARAIKAGGYATDPNYANKIISIVRNYGLTKYDVRGTLQENVSRETSDGDLDEVVTEVIEGKWGNGSARKKALTAAGWDYKTVQAEVNRRLK